MKKGLAILLTVALFVLLVSCGSTTTTANTTQTTQPTTGSQAGTQATTKQATTAKPTTATKAENKPVKIIFSSAAVPVDAHAEAQNEFKKVVEQVSGGNIKVEVYNNSTLFNQENEHAALINGDVDIIYSGSSWLATNSPWVSMFTAAYLFNNFDHMQKVMNGEIGQAMFKRIAQEQGIMPLASYYLGSRIINLRKDIKIGSRADLAGINLRVPNSESWIMMGRALGSNPTPLAFGELYLGLQTGTVDGQDNPLPSTYNAKFFEVTKSISMTNHLISDVWPTINVKKWNSLTEEQQGWVMQGIKAGLEYCNKTNLEREQSLVDTMKKAGLTFYYPDTKAYAEEVLAYYLEDKIFTAKWDMELFKQIRNMS